MTGENIKGKNLAFVLAIVFLAFICIFQFVYKPDYENLGGMHSWLSASTLKFVNGWLEEGAATHHFTCYESFDSIEFDTLSQRTPYVSYPTGSTFGVYTAAKILGNTHIDIFFLKHFQMVCYAIEALAFAAFAYLFLSGMKLFKEGTKTIFAILLTVTWMLLPVNVYYLSNIFFTDQFVILWVMLFLLLEYISHMELSSKAALVVNVLKVPLIIAGVLTDYYFWILVFIAFCMHFVRNIILKKKFWTNVKEALWYVCPVFLAVGGFVWQLTYTEGWQDLLIAKFFHRTGGLEEGNLYARLLKNFYTAFADANKIKLVSLLLFMGVLLVLVVHKIIKEKSWTKIFTNKIYYIFVLGVAAPILQILFLKNHSAIHEFSMLKLSWIIVMSIPAMAALLTVKRAEIPVKIAGKTVSRSVAGLVVTFVVMLVITGVPISANRYLKWRCVKDVYPLEEVLYETMDYEHVCFSFTKEIPINPPNYLAISEKQVYLVESEEEFDTYFPELDEDAIKVLVVEKNNSEKTPEIKNIEDSLIANNTCLYEDENCCLIELVNY